MTWRDFFNRPLYVFGLLGALFVLLLVLNPQVAADFYNKVMYFLMNLLVIALVIWAIRFMVSGGKKKGK